MTSNSDKLRSLILAALMVFSVFAGTVALTGSAAAEVSGNASASTFYGGQEIKLNSSTAGVEDNKEYQIRAVDTSGDNDKVGSLRRTITTNGSSYASFELDGRLSEGDFTIVPADAQTNPIDLDGDGNRSEVADDQFEVVTQDLSAQFDDESVGNDGDQAEVDFEIESNVRTSYAVNVSAQDDLDVGELKDIFVNNGPYDLAPNDIAPNGENEFPDADSETITIVRDATATNPTADGEETVNFQDIDAGSYTFVTNVTDTSASDTDTIEVTDTGDETTGFGDNVYSDQVGDVVNMTIELENTDTATVQVGDQSEDGYAVAAEIEDENEDGVAYVEFNSFEAGSGSGALSAGDDDTDVSQVGKTGFSGTPGVDALESGDYSLFVTADTPKDTYESSDADARGTLSLSEGTVDNLQMWTVPEDALSDLQSADAEDVSGYAQAGNLTQTSTIAQGDGVVVQVEASGLEGAFTGTDSASDYESIVGNNSVATNESAELPATLVFETQTGKNSQGNNDVTFGELNNVSNIEVLYDDDNDAHYVTFSSDDFIDAVNAENNDSSTDLHSDGDDYIANFTVYDENTELYEDTTTVDQEYTVEDPEIELDTNADDEIVLQAGPGQEVTGDTNLAPGTTIEATLDSDASGDPFVKRPEATVESDGTFTAVADFSDNSAGSEFTAEATASDFSGNLDSTSDEYDGRLTEFTGEPVTDTPDDGTDSPDTDTPDTDTPDTDTPDMDTDTATEETTDDGGETTETATGGSGPGFTAAFALIALVAAALLAVRRNN
ncbi:BGTF surface domain-containing protein [Haloarcula laminariae]|uniref:DUF7827 domain-containing protein n=1 Tax=Haloarcula laminariae TaxID=2961577 RepID=UPI0021C96B89|nr:BGTF surface domain-containing protein [Halomicroarcula laminariae]